MSAPTMPTRRAMEGEGESTNAHFYLDGVLLVLIFGGALCTE
jgi:hypothetical protein